jgi:hypothetical protein
MATGDVFSDAEIDDFLDRLAAKARRAGAADPSLSERAKVARAAADLTKEELMAQLLQKRLAIAHEISARARAGRLDAMAGDEAQRLHAYDLGSERQGPFSGSSVDAEGRARQMGLWGKVDLGLSTMPGLKDRLSNFWGFPEKGFDYKVADELARINGDGSVEPTGDEGALHAARVMAEQLEESRLMQNAQGAWINRLQGYVARQTHDRLKVAGGFWRELAEAGRNLQEGKRLDWATVRQGAARKAFGAWRDFIMPLLHEKTWDGLELADVPLEEDPTGDRQFRREQDLRDAAGLHARGILRDPQDLRERMLYRVWSDIVTGRHSVLTGMDDEADYKGGQNKAGAVSRARVLHFQKPANWVDYNNKFGTGSLFAAVMEQLSRGARNASLMERWGPAPDDARAVEVNRLADEARQRGDPDVANRLRSARQQADFEALNRRLNTPENLRLAMVLRGVRSWEAITKLGSIVLSKATDLPMTGHTFARAGAGFLKGYEGAIRGITHMDTAEGKRAAELLDVGARSFAGHIGAQFNATDGALGWGAWAQRLMYRINLFEYFNEGVRTGSATMLSRFLGQEAEHDWDGLQKGTRETFERFGVDPAAWAIARHGVTEAGDGMRYFTLDHIQDTPDEQAHAWARTPEDQQNADTAQRARNELELRFRTLIHDVIDNTTSEPRMRESTALAGGLRSGTIWGEAARSFGQFRGFLQTILGRHLAPAITGYAGYKPAALLAHFIVATALAGWLSMNAKLIVKGETPRPLAGEDLGETAKIWGAALAQGGGLGIYGDYLFGEANRNGLEFTLSSAAGPAIGDAEQVLQVIRQATHGGAISETTGRSQIPGEVVRLGAHNIPLINLWYTRLALDYLVLWRLQEAVSPGYLQRTESRVINQEHGGFIVPPTSAAP